ncbi:MAG: IclR family transcriptional regulator [Chloroflexi bacterium]|nr:MAG: IclR family transcriptional regulator [Chloroflexota bacterium]
MSDHPPLIQSVERAINVLEIIARGAENGISLKELSRELGTNPSTTHHLVATLVRHSILEQDPASKRYRLGIHLIELGNAALNSTSLARVAQPYLNQVFERTGQNVSLLVFHGLLRTPLLDVRSRQILTANSTPLEAFTLHATGSGKLLLAYLPEQELKSYLNSIRLERFTHNTITDPARLCEDLTHIREQGASYDMEEYGLGIRCISVPVQDASRRVVACFDMVFPSFEAGAETMRSLTAAMQKPAGELSNRLRSIGLVVS